ncbi:carboxypeptidase-like regulatory domain-containing protein [Niabella defluvii]|nr:carboxypeptidase-like regulatory domain-containing protein [Niabella sp. I65]
MGISILVLIAGVAAVHGQDQKTTGTGKKEVRGTVTDSTGVLFGVTVYVKNQTAIGTTTDANGKYKLDIPAGNATLVFEMSGYTTLEVPVGDQSVIDVTLKVSHSKMDEVVVVAFGTQKKGSVIGSVTTVRPEDLKIPSSNLTQALAGRVAGIIAYQRSGEPGADNSEFFVRGATTFGL